MSSYVKLFSSILDSTVWDTSPETRVVWITLLAMADRDGVVEAAVPGLAKRAGVTLEQCEAALARFAAPDSYSRTKAHDGRRLEAIDGGWRLLNYEAYRDKATVAEKLKKAADRQKRWREREAERNASVTRVTPVDASNTLRSISSPSAKAVGEGALAPQAPSVALNRKVAAHDAYRAWNDACQRAGHSLAFPEQPHAAAWQAIADACNVKSRPQLALDTLCAWLWTAADGPVKRERRPVAASRMTPTRMIAEVNSDLEQAYEWMVQQQAAS